MGYNSVADIMSIS